MGTGVQISRLTQSILMSMVNSGLSTSHIAIQANETKVHLLLKLGVDLETMYTGTLVLTIRCSDV